MLFYRCTTDKRKYDCSEQFKNQYAGTEASSVWIVGAGPGIRSIDTEIVQRSPACKMAMNYAGRGRDGEGYLIKPTFWTSYDPTPRWFGSMFKDSSITKFLKGGKHLDLVPGTSYKMCDCPNTFFVDVEHRYYEHFFDTKAKSILNVLDSFIQAIDICFQLGFRTFYCVGTDMIVRPSEAQVALARAKGVEYEKGQVKFEKQTGEKQPECYWSDRLIDFRDMCKAKGIGKDNEEVAAAMEAVEREAQYGCEEIKRFSSAVTTDVHYWDRIQYLRLSRRNHSLNGVKIISCTPNSRLNAFFPYMTEVEAANAIDKQVGNVLEEYTSGRLTDEPKPDEDLPYHKDMDIYGRNVMENQEKGKPEKKPDPIAKKALELNREMKVNEIG